MDLMHISLSLVVGFLAGGIVTYLFVTRFSSKHKIQDELTRYKRDLATAHRRLEEFFSGSDEKFNQLTKSYIDFARYMSDACRGLSPDADCFRLDNLTRVSGSSKKSLKESLMALKEQVSDITATIDEQEAKSMAAQTEDEGAQVEEIKKEKKAEPAKIKEAEEPEAKSKARQESEPEEEPAPKKAKAKEEAPKEAQEDDGLEETPKTIAKPEIKISDEDDEPVVEQPKDFVEKKEPQKI